MFKITKKIVSFLLLLLILVSITGCSVEKDKTVVAEKFIDSEGVSASNLPRPSGGFVGCAELPGVTVIYRQRKYTDYFTKSGYKLL